MTAIELKTRVYQQIAHLNEAQLKKLYQLLEQEFHAEASSPEKPKKRPLGLLKDRIWMTNDWDSYEVNEEIARLFNDGPVFPDEN